MRTLESRLAAVAAEPNSDLVLDRAQLAAGDNGGALFTMTGTVKEGEGGWFVWVVDRQRKTYRLIRMDGTPRDAIRIAEHLATLGVPADLNGIQARIDRARANRARQRKEAVSHHIVEQRLAPPRPDRSSGAPQVAPDDENQYETQSWGSCSGSTEGHVETWELASLVAGPFPLTRSYAFNQWAGWWDETGSSWVTDRGGSCWAEPLSFAFTTWYWDTCDFHFPGIYFGFSDVLVTGNYHNWDFGFDDLPTFVFSGIGLTGSNRMVTYNSFHYADGEGVFSEDWGLALIWGEVWISPFSFNTCP